ncbi:hypothetical protein B4U84_24300 [Westiellopsis prolifica IICB1]|nr:hypothetical protein B4U84_24300 [Westiellopsis prolifica IICB1]
MSVSGLARLCGIGQSTVSMLLRSLTDISKTAPKSLEVLRGKELSPSGNHNWEAPRVIFADVCASIIEYYAFESRAKSQQALEAYRQFAKVGIHTWILHTTGFTSSEGVELEPKASISGYSQ